MALVVCIRTCSVYCTWCALTTVMYTYMLCSYNGWLAGYQTAFDTAKSKATQNNFAVGYSKDDITIHTAV